MGRQARSVAALHCHLRGGKELEVCGGGQGRGRQNPSDVRAAATQGCDVRGRDCRRGSAAAGTVVIRGEGWSSRLLAAAGVTVGGWPRPSAVRTLVPHSGGSRRWHDDCGRDNAIASGAAALRWRTKRLHDRERGGKRSRAQRSGESAASAATAHQLLMRRHESNKKTSSLKKELLLKS